MTGTAAGLDFGWPDHLLRLREEALKVGADAARGRRIREDSWVVGYDREFSQELGRRGWLGMCWPRRYGGHERAALDRLVVAEALIETGAPIAASWFADRQVGPSLLAFGTEAQRERFLPEMTRGEANWSIGMSEPDNGSDLANLRTVARREGNVYVVNGRKTWTSFGATADWIYLICRTGDARSGHRGLSELIVDLRSPGIEIVPIRDLTSAHHFCEVSFDDVRVPVEHLVGVENESWRQTMAQLEHERGGIDRLASNRHLFQTALERADLSDPTVRQEAATIEARYRIGRLLVLKGVVGQAGSAGSAVSKVFCTELEQRIARFCTRVAGAEATLENRWSRAQLYSPAYTIMGGTSQVLRTVIGERKLGLPRVRSNTTTRSRPT